MSRYRRSLAAGATFFFTVNLANGSSRLRVEEIGRLRRAFDITRSRHPFLTLAYCVLPDHMHTVWEMPENDADFGLRWRVIKRLFTSGLAPASTRSTSKIVKREKVFGSGGSGSIKFATTPIYSTTWITSISTP